MTALDYAREKGLDYVVALMVCDDSAVMDFAKASRLVYVFVWEAIRNWFLIKWVESLPQALCGSVSA